MSSASLNGHDAASPSLVGRNRETAQLSEALDRAAGGQGSALMVAGPAGIGKSRLLRWSEGQARDRGFRVLWGHCMKDALAPFFPFEQIFREKGGTSPTASARARQELPAVLLFEEEKPRRSIELFVAHAGKGPGLILSRERPELVRQRLPDLPASTSVLWLSRSEGGATLSPLKLDALGEQLEGFLREHEGGAVALTGLEYLVSQNAFLPVLRLVQFLRDAAESAGGHVILSAAPRAFAPRELSLIEAEAEVIREIEAAAPAATATAGPETPTHRLLHYLSSLEKGALSQPHLLLLEDFQWADPMSVRAFQFLARNVRTLPVLLLAAARDDELSQREDEGESTLVEVLDGLSREGVLKVLPLPALSAPESAELASNTLGGPTSLMEEDAGLSELLGRMGGNPYYLLETLHDLQELGQLRRERGRVFLDPSARSASSLPGEEGGAALPPTVRRLLLRRLERLPPEDQVFLRRAAVLGPEFDLATLAEAQATRAEDLVERARSLADRRILRREPGAPTGWAFTDSILWEVALSLVPPEELRSTSRALAVWWATHRPQDVENVARLFHLAGSEEAITWARQAIGRALEARSGAVVERYVRWIRELLPPDAATREAVAREEIGWARRLDAIGYTTTAVRIFRETLSAPLPDALRWEGKVALANTLTHADPRDGDRVLLELESEIPPFASGGPAAVHAEILLAKARRDELQGRWDRVVDSTDRALALLGERGERGSLSSAHAMKAWAFKELNRLPEAEQELAKGLELSRGSGSWGLLSSQLNIRGAILEFRGDLKGASAAFSEAVEVSKGAGVVTNTIIFLTNLAEAHLMMGEVARARAEASEALLLSRRFSLVRSDMIARHMWACVLRQEGRLPEARAALEEACAEFVRVGLADDLGASRLHLAEVKIDQGEFTTAFQELSEIEMGRAGSLESRLRPQVDRLRGRIRLAQGHPAEARQSLETALKGARAIGNRFEEAAALDGLAQTDRAEGRPKDAEVHERASQELLRLCGVTDKSFLTPALAARPGLPSHPGA